MKSIKKRLKVYVSPYMLVLGLFVTAVLFLIYRSNYPFFQLLVQASGLILAAFIFLITIKTFKYSRNNLLLFVGYNFLYITILNFINLAIRPGAGITPGINPRLQPLFVILGEYLYVIMLAAAPFFIRTKPPRLALLGVYSVLTGVFITMVAWPNIYRTLIGANMKLFTVVSGYIIMFVLGITLLHLAKRRRDLTHSLYYIMLIYIGLTAFSEIRFIFYSNGPVLINFLGEIARIGSYLFICHIIIILGIDHPYEFIAELKECAIRDPLTGLMNRKGLLEFVRKELARVRREGYSMGILLMDVDRFKSINDRHGHVAGDQVLKKFAEILANVVRESDLICRLGGDEFVLVMKGNIKDLHLVRMRIAEAVERWKATDKIARNIGVSIGCALWDLTKYDITSVEQFDSILDIADRDMYREKMRKKAPGKCNSEAQLQIFNIV